MDESTKFGLEIVIANSEIIANKHFAVGLRSDVIAEIDKQQKVGLSISITEGRFEDCKNMFPSYVKILSEHGWISSIYIYIPLNELLSFIEWAEINKGDLIEHIQFPQKRIV